MEPITRQEQYLARIAGDTDFPLPESPKTREEQYLARIAAQSGGTTDYTDLENKPQINGVELSGNKTAAQLNVAGLDESGKVPMSILPPAAIERLVAVADDTARFALTTDTVQLGDTVKVTATNKMYMVIDTEHLDTEAGYSVYVAGKAAEAVADEDGNNIKNTYFKTANIDSALSTTSENPVQNKVITDALGGKVGTTDYATAATAGIVKPDGVTTTVDADGTIHATNIDVTSWYGVRDIVRRGLASRFFQVGDQLACEKDGVKIRWDIVGIDQDTPADSNFIHSMTLMAHEVYIQAAFDAREALFAFDDGLEAGTYHFTIDQQYWVAGDVGKVVQFTLANDIPAGGQLVINNAYNATVVGATISAFSGGASATAAETVTMTEGSDGTDLGSVGNALTGTTANSIQRALLGSNNWSQSAARQYLNSDKAAGAYWVPKTKWDRPPAYVASTAGFLKGLDGDFVGVLGKVIKTTSQNTVTDGGGGIQSEELVFLPSRSEIYGSAEITGVNEGTIYDYYKSATDADRIKYQGTAAHGWFLRTPNASFAYVVRVVSSSGVLGDIYASYAIGLAPVCCIV